MLHERAVKEAGLAVVTISVIDLYSVTRVVAFCSRVAATLFVALAIVPFFFADNQ